MASNLQQDDAELMALKANIGFGTAFKATLGFYLAQFVASVIGLLVLGVVAAIVLSVIYFVSK